MLATTRAPLRRTLAAQLQRLPVVAAIPTPTTTAPRHAFLSTMAAASKTRVPLIFGTMTIGEPGKVGTRIGDLPTAQKVLDIYFATGQRELDTARVYAEGTSEARLSKLDLKGSAIDTKVYPSQPGSHKPEKLRKTFEESLATLNVSKVRTLYLHMPDRSVPFDETAKEVDSLYKEGKIEQFGLSNYTAWEVAEIVTVCRERGYVQPKIYQAMYNGITRAIEPELVPCLRKYGIRLVVYNPLAGGFFAGKITKQDDKVESGGRFDPTTRTGAMYRKRYLHDTYFGALAEIRTAVEAHGIRLTEAALRWVQHHSVLDERDGVILGASSVEQNEMNCSDSEKGPLPQAVVDAIDRAWEMVKSDCPPYWR